MMLEWPPSRPAPAGDGLRPSRRASAVAAVIAAALVAGCGASSPSAAQVNATTPLPQPSFSLPSSIAPSSPVTSASASPQTSGPPTAVPVAPGAGALPQPRLPSTDTAAFRDAMQDLWLAVTTGNARLALPSFFPAPPIRS